jgi:hypothetical protein
MSPATPHDDQLPFVSRTIWEHLVRGVIGIGAFACALLWAGQHPWLAAIAIPVGFVALRGCPFCWTLGLVLTVVAKIQGRSTEAGCSRGCAPNDSGSGGVRL